MKNRSVIKTIVGFMGLMLALNIVPAQKVLAEETENQETVREGELLTLPDIFEMSDEERMELEREQEEEMFREIRKDASGGVWSIINISTYNADGSVKGHTDYTCNTAGNMTSYKMYTGDVLECETQYTYDANGNMTRSISTYYEKEKIDHVYQSSYDANGNVILDAFTYYNEDGSIDDTSYRINYIYEGSRRIKEEEYDIEDNLNYTTDYIYEGDNLILEKTYSHYYNTPRLYSCCKYSYDANGNQTESAYYFVSSDGIESLYYRIISTWIYVQGYGFFPESFFYYNSENVITSGWVVEFGENGDREKRIDYSNGGEVAAYTLYENYDLPSNASVGTQVQRRENTYDKNDNLISYTVTTYQLYSSNEEGDTGNIDNTSQDGLILASDGNWYYYVNGAVAGDYTGLVYDANVGWWYVENGKINFNYNGLIYYGDAWWCVAGGQVRFDYTGLWNDANVGWWYVENGAVNFGYNGLIYYNDAWWCVAGGQVRFDYTGLWNDANVGWWYVENGVVNFDYNGLVYYGDAWWCVAGGQVRFDYTGLWYDANVGWWYVENGAVNFDYNGLVYYGDAWWCVAGGQVCFDYTGLWYDANVGWWYVENGAVNFGYNGSCTYNGAAYQVVNGAVVF